MQRITITMDDSEAEWLKREAHRQSTSVSALVRHWVRERRPGAGRAETSEYPFAFMGIGASAGRPDAARIDEELAEGWGDAIERDSGLRTPDSGSRPKRSMA
jgi:hypothetical protein